MKRRWMLLLCVLTLCALLLCGCATAEDDTQTMRLFAINVGKADCLLLSYEDVLYMVDTGTEESWGSVSAALTSFGIRRLDGVIVTHTDKDHAGGCAALAASSIEVGTWYASEFYADVKESKHPAVKAAALRGQTVTWLSAGVSLPFGSGSLRVLGPMRYNEKENCNSVVLLAEGAGGSMLLAGDMEFPEEEDLLNAGQIPPCTVLKVGNHAESDATSDALIAQVRPQIAVISTNSDEEPDTPAKRVMKLLQRVGAQIAITQNAPAGVMVTLQNGRAQASLTSYEGWPAQEVGVRLTAKENENQTTVITNEGDHAIDVSGWFIFSERGGETFIFPQGAVLAPNQSVTITSLSTPWEGDYVWPDTKIWHKSKSDPAVLYDQYGRMINRIE